MDETIRENLSHITKKSRNREVSGLVNSSRIWVLSIFMLFQTQLVGFPRLAFLMIIRWFPQFQASHPDTTVCSSSRGSSLYLWCFFKSEKIFPRCSCRTHNLSSQSLCICYSSLKPLPYLWPELGHKPAFNPITYKKE